jgi:hypothetical protein
MRHSPFSVGGASIILERTIFMGYIYFVRSGDYVKIGRTEDRLKSRLSQLQTGSPVILVLVAYIELKDTSEAEKKFHEHFSEFWQAGEWFMISDAQILSCLAVANSFFTDAKPTILELPKNEIMIKKKTKKIVEVNYKDLVLEKYNRDANLINFAIFIYKTEVELITDGEVFWELYKKAKLCLSDKHWGIIRKRFQNNPIYNRYLGK